MSASRFPNTRFRRLVHVPECTSTQDLSLADPGTEPAVFWADHQTAGRGRQGRAWDDDRALDLAVTLRVPVANLDNPVHLAVAMPVALAATVDPIVPAVRFKWPNDLLVGGRKLAGILIDSDAAGVHHIGIGLNVNRRRLPEDLADTATSLALETGAEFERGALLTAVVGAVDDVLGKLERGDLAVIEADFRDRLGLVGRSVVVRSGSRELAGLLSELTLDRLVVGTDSLALAHVTGLRPA